MLTLLPVLRNSYRAVTGQQQDYAAPPGEYWPEYDGYGNNAGASSASAGRGDNAGPAAGQYGAGAGAGAAGGYGASQAGGYSAQPPQGPPQPVRKSVVLCFTKQMATYGREFGTDEVVCIVEGKGCEDHVRVES